MDDAFEKLIREGQNSVDTIIQWMKESKVIDNTKQAEDEARKLFDGVKDKANVELDNFKQALTKIAELQQKNVEELAEKLNEEGPRVLNALKVGASEAVSAGISAFKDAMKK